MILVEMRCQKCNELLLQIDTDPAPDVVQIEFPRCSHCDRPRGAALYELLFEGNPRNKGEFGSALADDVRTEIALARSHNRTSVMKILVKRVEVAGDEN